MVAIWKDIIIDLTSYLSGGDSVTYSVYDSSTLLYTGKAFKTPDGNCKVRINDILANNLKNELPAQFPVTGAYLTNTEFNYTVKVGVTTVATDRVSMCYDYQTSSAGIWPRADILGYYDRRMPVIITSYFWTVNPYVKIDGVEYSAAGYPFNAVRSAGTVGTFWIGYDDKHVDVTRKDTCSRYALYYINAMGGWDALLMSPQGSIETDTYKRHTIGQVYNNASRLNAGTVCIGNEVTRTWRLRTPLLSDAQAALMHHLIGSNTVYLFDMVLNTYDPVIITDTNCVYKTYRNQGMKRVYYDINVTVAHDMIRR